MNKRILLDMDGVLCDYDRWIDLNHGRKENGKSNWDYLSQIGSPFWSEMPWLDEGKKLYSMLLEYVSKHNDVELGILSAIFLWCGQKGKREWLAKNCPEIKKENIIINNKGIEKYKYGDKHSILVDDKAENCELYQAFTGDAVNFISAEQAYADIIKLIES